MKIGFTGTRNGMELNQHWAVFGALAALSLNLKSFEFHHGDCVGSDEVAARIAHELGAVCHSHPCDLARYRAHTELLYDTIEYPVQPPLVRNQIIVDTVDIMIATPATLKESDASRSGTWATIRYAKKRCIPLMVFYPA